MYVLLGRRCEVKDCHNKARVVEIPVYGARVLRICPECIGKALSACIQTPIVERKKGD